MTIGPNTVDVIKTVLHSREQEVQTYRLCLGIIGFAKNTAGKRWKNAAGRLSKQVNRIIHSSKTPFLLSPKILLRRTIG